MAKGRKEASSPASLLSFLEVLVQIAPSSSTFPVGQEPNPLYSISALITLGTGLCSSLD